MSYIKKIFWILFSGLIPISILFIALYLFDPLQIFHKPFWREKFFSSNIREQIPGIVRNYDFNSIILGSSLLANTSSKETEEKLGGKWVNFSIPGGSPIEKITVLDFVIQHKKIEKIIMSISDFEFQNNNYFLLNSLLYEQNIFKNLFAYREIKFIFCLLQDSFCLKDKQKEFDNLSRWGNQEWVKPLLGGIKSWITNANKQDIKKNLAIIQNFEGIRKKNLLATNELSNLQKILIQNPHINFFLIIPPLSRIYYKINIIQTKQIIKQILQLDLHNIYIFGFDTTEIPDNLANYIDLVHYDEKVNSFMLDAIKNDTHRIALENIDSYFEEMQKKVEAYDIEPLKKQIIESGVLNK